MSEYQKILAENAEWYSKFQSMKVTGTCDATLCKKPATRWFGNTSCATCDDDKCISEMQDKYNAAMADMESEE